LPLCILLSTQTQAQPETAAGANNETDVPTIAVTKLDITDKTLKLSYEIRNEAKYDTWILVGFEKFDSSAEAFMDKDGQTILIRRRFDVPFAGGNGPVYGRYVRMHPGQIQAESVSLAIPVRPNRGFAPSRKTKGLELATRLAIEIGFYSGNLPWMISDMLEEIEQISDTSLNEELNSIKFHFGGLLQFNTLNEGLRQRDEEILVPYTYQTLKGEHVLRTKIDGLLIPYEEKEDLLKPYLPDLTPCTRVEIECKPSTLEYFFPYEGQQSLLNQAEIRSLRSLRTIVMEDQEQLKALACDVNEGVYSDGLVRQRRIAHVMCYRDDERLNSFTIYNDASILNEGKYRFLYFDGFPSLRMLTPQIQPYELRVRCAANLRNLWHRLRLYQKAEKTRLMGSSHKVEMAYPAPTKWCDDIVKAYRSIRMLDKDLMRPHMCPDAGEGKCHYAMNPNCKPNSPGDMVLLFETKGGWNQHGGPELFTFDNHDPRGGCVLLNDGTVKFIRTTEELRQLRWN